MPTLAYWGTWFLLAALAPHWPLGFAEVVGITALSLVPAIIVARTV